MNYKIAILFAAIGLLDAGCTRAADALSVCDVLTKPATYDGKEITIYADVLSSFHGVLALSKRSQTCVGVIALTPSPDGSKSSALLFKSETEPGSGYHHGYITGEFKYYPNGLPSGRNIKGEIKVEQVEGWKSERRP